MSVKQFTLPKTNKQVKQLKINGGKIISYFFPFGALGLCLEPFSCFLVHIFE